MSSTRTNDNQGKNVFMPNQTSATATTTGSVQPLAEHGSSRGLSQFIRRHGLVSFYALAYGLSWLAWLPYILSQDGLGVFAFSVPKLLGTAQFLGVLPGAYLGPLGAAFIVTAISEGRAGLRRWRGRLLRFGVSGKWYAIAFFSVPALLMVGTLIVAPESVAGFRLPTLALLLFYIPALLLQVVTTGLAEEPGWRDFALVRHQRRQGPLLGTLILSLLWAVWHFPLFLTEWGAALGGVNPRAIVIFTGFCIAISIVITWIFNKTRGSLPLAILVHVSNNNFASVLWFAMFTTLAAQDALLGGVVGFGVVALVILAATRGKLGYDPQHDDEVVKTG